MLRFVGGYVRNSGEHVGAVRCGALNAVAMIDTTFACFMVDIKNIAGCYKNLRCRHKDIALEE
jgi:hypothetical protein